MELDNKKQQDQDENPEAIIQADPIMESLSDAKESLAESLLELDKIRITTENTFVALGVIPNMDTYIGTNPPEHLLDVYRAMGRAEEAMGYLNRAIELSNLLPDSS